jgi:hypothetical protein
VAQPHHAPRAGRTDAWQPSHHAPRHPGAEPRDTITNSNPSPRDEKSLTPITGITPDQCGTGMVAACRISSAAQRQERHDHASIRTTSTRFGDFRDAVPDHLPVPPRDTPFQRLSQRGVTRRCARPCCVSGDPTGSRHGPLIPQDAQRSACARPRWLGHQLPLRSFARADAQRVRRPPRSAWPGE